MWLIHLNKILITVLLLINETHGNCKNEQNEGLNSRANYVLRPTEETNSILFHKFNYVINSCRLGKQHELYDRNVCFDHCTLHGGDCLGVEISSIGCKFCLRAQYNGNRIANVDFNQTYINNNVVRG